MRRTTQLLSILLCFVLLFEQSGFAQVETQNFASLHLSAHLASFRNTLSTDKYRPLHLRYLGYDAKSNDFKLLLDKGDFVKNNINEGRGTKDEGRKKEKIEQETNKLMEYFFIGLSLPNESFWVNLRPDSPDNVIDSELAKTDIGKILLEADVQLKKDTALYTSPQTTEGKKYWDKLYKKAEELYGYDNITIPTLTRPWIVPGEIIIRETRDDGRWTRDEGRKTIPSAYIYKATLKVMLEEDYLQREQKTEHREQKNIVGTGLVPVRYEFKDSRAKELNRYSTELIRELIIPKITKDINTTKRYAELRQVYYSLILAQWFKKQSSVVSDKSSVKNNLQLTTYDLRLRINSNNLTGLTSKTPWSKDTYYQEYQKSFKDGEYNLKEPARTPFGQTIRSYFSGGMSFSINVPRINFGNPGQVVSNGVTTVIEGNTHRSLNMSDLLEMTYGKTKVPEVKIGGNLEIDILPDNELEKEGKKQVSSSLNMKILHSDILAKIMGFIKRVVFLDKGYNFAVEHPVKAVIIFGGCAVVSAFTLWVSMDWKEWYRKYHAECALKLLMDGSLKVKNVEFRFNDNFKLFVQDMIFVQDMNILKIDTLQGYTFFLGRRSIDISLTNKKDFGLVDFRFVREDMSSGFGQESNDYFIYSKEAINLAAKYLLNENQQVLFDNLCNQLRPVVYRPSHILLVAALLQIMWKERIETITKENLLIKVLFENFGDQNREAHIIYDEAVAELRYFEDTLKDGRLYIFLHDDDDGEGLRKYYIDKTEKSVIELLVEKGVASKYDRISNNAINVIRTFINSGLFQWLINHYKSLVSKEQKYLWARVIIEMTKDKEIKSLLTNGQFNDVLSLYPFFKQDKQPFDSAIYKICEANSNFIANISETLHSSMLDNYAYITMARLLCFLAKTDMEKAKVSGLLMRQHSVFKEFSFLGDERVRREIIPSDIEFVSLIQELVREEEFITGLSMEDRKGFSDLLEDRYRHWPKGGVSYIVSIIPLFASKEISLDHVELSKLKLYNSYFSHFSEKIYKKLKTCPNGKEKEFLTGVQTSCKGILDGRAYEEVKRDLQKTDSSIDDRFIFDLLMIVSPKFRAGVSDEELMKNLSYGAKHESQWRKHIEEFIATLDRKQAGNYPQTRIEGNRVIFTYNLPVIQKSLEQGEQLEHTISIGLLDSLSKSSQQKEIVEILKPQEGEEVDQYVNRIRENYLQWLGGNDYVQQRIEQIRETFQQGNDFLAMALLTTLIADGFKDVLRQSPQAKGKEFNKLLNSLEQFFALPVHTVHKTANNNTDIAQEFIGIKRRLLGRLSRGKAKQLGDMTGEERIDAERQLYEASYDMVSRYIIALDQNTSKARWQLIVKEISNKDNEAAKILEEIILNSQILYPLKESEGLNFANLQERVFGSLHRKLFSDVVQGLNENQSRFNERVKEMETLEFEITKTVWQAVYGITADICIWGDLGLLDKAGFMPVAMRANGQFVGYVNMHVINKGKQKIILLAGINPTDQYLSTHNLKQIYDKIINVFETIAILSGSDMLGITMTKGAISNRNPIIDIVQQQKYPTDKLGFEHPVGVYVGRNIKYESNEYFVVWEKGPKPIDAQILDKIFNALPKELQPIMDVEELYHRDRMAEVDIKERLTNNTGNIAYLQKVYSEMIGRCIPQDRAEIAVADAAAIIFQYGRPLSRMVIDLRDEVPDGGSIEITCKDGINFDFVKQNRVLLLANPISSAINKDESDLPRNKERYNEIASQRSAKEPASSSIENKQTVFNPGGIDFGAMQIGTQLVNSPQSMDHSLWDNNFNTVLSPLKNASARADELSNDSVEWLQIQKMVHAGIVPSSQRIREYLVSSCVRGEFNQEMDKVICCISDVFRLEEERLNSADSDMCEILGLVESCKTSSELLLALSRQ